VPAFVDVDGEGTGSFQVMLQPVNRAGPQIRWLLLQRLWTSATKGSIEMCAKGLVGVAASECKAHRVERVTHAPR